MRCLKLTIIALILGNLALMLLGVAAWAGVALAQAPQSDPAAPPDFFIEAEVNNAAPYLGQQIIYTLNRYQVGEFPSPPYYEPHAFAGFWNTALLQRPSYVAIVRGRKYLVRPTHIALFPLTTGPTTIAPARLIIPGDGPEADLVLESESIEVQVQPLPTGAPFDFGGAVGQFELNAHFDRTESRIDEALTLSLEIKGTGNIEILAEPVVPNSNRWRFFNRRVTTDAPLAKEIVKGVRRFEWSVTPGQAGPQEFPSLSLSYYDPQLEAYQTLRTDPIPITILPAPEASTFAGPLPPLKQPVQPLAGDIRHIKPVPAALKNAARLIIPAFLYGVCAILPPATLGGVWFWRAWQQRRRDNSLSARSRRAWRQAKKVLATAPDSPDAYPAIQQALLGYLSDKLAQPVGGLTSDQLFDLLQAAQLDPQLINRLHTLLMQIDLGRFAPVAKAPDPTAALKAEVQALLDDLEQFFGKDKYR